MQIANTAVIPFSQVIAVAKSRIGIDNTDSDNFFAIELQNTMRNYASNNTIVRRTQVVTVANRTFTIPSGLLKIIGMKRQCDDTPTDEDEDDNTFPWVVIANFYRGYFPSCDCFENYFYIGEDGFGHTRTGDVAEGDYILSFWGYNTDSYGRMMIREDYEDFLADYLCYMWLKRPVNQHAYGNPYLGPNASQEFRKSYMAKKARVKGLENKMNFKAQESAISWELNRVLINNFDLLFVW